MHPIGAFVVGGIGSLLFVYGFQLEQEKFRIDDVLGVWPLHGVVGTWGGIAAGIFGSSALGGIGGVSFLTQLAGSLLAVAYAIVTSFVVYLLIDKTVGFRLNQDQEFVGSDLTVHQINAYPEENLR
jgi:Amt family ammonium transporter